MPLRVIHTVHSLDPAAGGPSRTVTAITEALSKAGVDTTLVATDRGGAARALTPASDQVTIDLTPAAPWWRRPWRFGRAVVQHATHHDADLVHDHGVWLLTNIASDRAAKAAGVPYVLSTRGMLEPWALNHQAFKKKLAWHAYQCRIVAGASLLHATALAEARQLRTLGLTAPIVVAPNGVHLPDRWKQEAGGKGPRRALFLSRVHPKKGLLTLVRAWAAVAPAGWTLTIAGPDEGGHTEEVQRLAQHLGIADALTFPGSIADEEKWALYRSADLFVLPTYSENFGVVVAEALSCGVPVLTTTGAPWAVLEEAQCGWWVPPEFEPIAHALAEATTCTDAKRLAMGARGRALVKERFTWPAVATVLREAYQWVLHGGSVPPGVYPAHEPIPTADETVTARH